ncbi:hypothetical protein EVJ58_g10728 [Rhodofomes roseus]|uniref:Uncharacterized protein n=1 Tax=Rhodofomes roseus TaxID=34475 RepID=A0A4Y9XPH3_9APHY|nr:hypothetical protein EVJ58_g10728 [Rhodofomes roseus]
MFSLRRSAAAGYRDNFTTALQWQAARTSVNLGAQPFAEFVKICDRHREDIPTSIRTALAFRTKQAEHQRKAHARLVSKLGLKALSEDEIFAAFENLATTIYLPRLSQAYPDVGNWRAKQADKRLPRHPMLVEELSKLARVIPAGENAIIRDSETRELIAVVIRDWCSNPAVVASLNKTVAKGVGLCVSVRKEDTGKIVLVGYSAGSRSRPYFDWSRNVRSKKHTAEFLQNYNMTVSSAFALMWNMMRARLPKELLADLDEYLAVNNLCRMDGNRTMKASADGCGEYFVEKGDTVITFAHEKLAPPGAVMGANYARAIHSEAQPHKFAYSWTTGRNTDLGGSFYVASHGIKIEQAANTFIAWQPRLAHGTSMLACDPHLMEPPFAQQGMSIVSSMRLATTWKRYMDGLISAEQAAKEYADSLEDGVEDGSK